MTNWGTISAFRNKWHDVGFAQDLRNDGWWVQGFSRLAKYGSGRRSKETTSHEIWISQIQGNGETDDFWAFPISELAHLDIGRSSENLVSIVNFIQFASFE